MSENPPYSVAEVAKLTGFSPQMGNACLKRSRAC
jgi:hypothetical protein